MKQVCGFIAMSAVEFADSKTGKNPLVSLAMEISLDGRGARAVTREAPEAAPRTVRVGHAPGKAKTFDDVPDAPETVLAGHGNIVQQEVDEDDPQRGGLSAPGSYEAAMRMFGPQQITISHDQLFNPHGTHEVTDEG